MAGTGSHPGLVILLSNMQNIKAKSGASGTKSIFNIYPWWYYKWKFKFDVISWCHLGLCDAYQNLYTIEILKHIIIIQRAKPEG